MRKIVVLLWCSVVYFANAQDFKLDNVAYQTIDWNGFFEKLDQNPKLVFFDIRTPGERNDDSEYLSYNQGKIKGAIETDFWEFEKYYPQYLKHKNDTLYLYCSHSKRSRLLAKRLSDSLFTKVVSINGGLSYLNNYRQLKFSRANGHYTNRLNYDLITPFDFVNKVTAKNTLVIDVRPDSIYYEKARVEWENSFGTIKNVLHVPFDKIQESSVLIDTQKEIVLFDNEGSQAPMAANYFFKQGKKVGVLLFGLDNLQSTVSSEDRKFLKAKYRVILPYELLQLSKESNTILIDTRTPSEFSNKDSVAAKNVGRLKNAVNIPLDGLSKEAFQKFKGKKIVLYDLMMHDELYEYAKRLKALGITDFYLLAGGINLVKWEIANADQKGLVTLID